MTAQETTWDGQPISQDKPHGVTIVVYRYNEGRLEFLILHRTYAGPDYEGDWAWTPPSGARYPGEDVDTCARRELFEETGLDLTPTLTDCGTEEWWVYTAEVSPNAQIQLSVEHDRYEWLPIKKAAGKCQPEVVDDLESSFRQRLELGLYNQPGNRLEAMKTLTFARALDKFQFILILVDYNPYSAQLNLAHLANLPFPNQIKVFSTGFAMWEQNFITPNAT